ncbi:MAG TPA: ankyrin repeat domain-containing protein [Verrucomicrobiae bacterium]|nr:ankyrin repeat domain-containing protein [Verrucomicrobiae bacterium]
MRNRILRFVPWIVVALGAPACLPHPATPLAIAARAGDVVETRRLMDGGARAEDPDPEGWTPLMWAARAGATSTMAALIDSGARVDRRDGWIHGWTPLLHAIHKGQIDSARLLLDRGADVNGASTDGLTPIVAAAGGCDCDAGRNDADMDAIFFLLLERGANPREGRDAESRALTNAVADGRTEVVRALLARAPELRLRDDLEGRISLLLARLRGRTEIVSLISRSESEK